MVVEHVVVLIRSLRFFCCSDFMIWFWSYSFTVLLFDIGHRVTPLYTL
jgi:hypothetical protein